MNELSK
jgi:hypothetical protein